MRDEGLRHRCTYVAVETSDGALVVHRRADWKDVYPGHWDLAFGGVAGVGEDWTDAARRELAEEAGVDGVELLELGPVAYDHTDGSIVGRVYLTVHDGPLDCPDGEVVAVDRVRYEDLARWVAEHPVCRDTHLVVLPLLLRNRGLDPGSIPGPSGS
ncbi:MAG: NUDIX domain-containing protein [Actinomycetota bacterium]